MWWNIPSLTGSVDSVTIRLFICTFVCWNYFIRSQTTSKKDIPQPWNPRKAPKMPLYFSKEHNPLKFSIKEYPCISLEICAKWLLFHFFHFPFVGNNISPENSLVQPGYNMSTILYLVIYLPHHSSFILISFSVLLFFYLLYLIVYLWHVFILTRTQLHRTFL